MPATEEASMSSTRRLAAAAALVLLAATPMPTSYAGSSTDVCGAQRGLGIRLMDAAVSRQNDPRAHIYIDDFVNPGTTITRHVEVSDCTANPMHLNVYPDAASIGPTGWNVASGHSGNELTSWTQATPKTLDLSPHESATVTVVIAVPSNASTGERYEAILAELPAPKGGGNVHLASRVGVRVYLDVGPGGEPPSDFSISTLTAERSTDGIPEVVAHVTNTGKRALDIGGSLSLSGGPGGLRAGPFDVQVPQTLGIGETGNVTVALDKQTPAGPWQARLRLDSGYVQHTVTGRITFPSHAGVSAKPVVAHSVDLAHNRNVIVPIAIGLLLLAAIGLLLLWLRRRKKDDDEDEAGPR
jgi:hypothetical protein